MSTFSIVLVAAAFAIIIAVQWGAIEDLLPGGRFNPYTAANVEKGRKWVRAAAHATALVVVLCLFAAAFAIEWRLHAS